MGKGDLRTKKGKIYRGTFGKKRMRKKANAVKQPVKTSGSTKK